MKRLMILLATVALIGGCTTAPAARTSEVQDRTAINLEQQGRPDLAEDVRSVDVADYTDPATGLTDVPAFRDAVEAEVPDADEGIVHNAAREAMDEMGVSKKRQAWWLLGLAVVPLVLRKALPMVVAATSGTPVGALVGPIVNALIFSKDTYAREKAKRE